MPTKHNRFWSKVAIAGPDECWSWLASRNSHGYGTFGIKCQTCAAHRIAWILTNGPIPSERWVLHKCDNRLCCNPRHLFLGTHRDNMDDMVQKGRHTKGECSSRAKLTKIQVLEIRARYKAGDTSQSLLGIEYGVSHGCISAIIRRENWHHLTETEADVDC